MTNKTADSRIRDARPEDAEAIAEVHVRSWQETYVGLLPDDFLKSLDGDIQRRTEVWRKATENLPARSLLLVAEVDDQVVGFANAAACEDPDLDSELVGELRVIYLRARFWGRGIGKAMHDEAICRLWSFGFNEAMLWVLDSNERTRRWYERQGWRTDGATKVDDRGTFVLNEVRYRLDLVDFQ